MVTIAVAGLITLIFTTLLTTVGSGSAFILISGVSVVMIESGAVPDSSES
jgi:hypothetical protein